MFSPAIISVLGSATGLQCFPAPAILEGYSRNIGGQGSTIGELKINEMT